MSVFQAIPSARRLQGRRQESLYGKLFNLFQLDSYLEPRCTSLMTVGFKMSCKGFEKDGLGWQDGVLQKLKNS